MKNNTVLKSVLFTALMAATSGQAIAEDKRVSDGIAPGDTDSKWLLGTTFGGINNEIVGEDSDSEGFFNINVAYRGEKFFMAKDEIGYNLYRDNGMSFGVVGSSKMSFLFDKDMYDDNKVLAHLKEREGTIDLGVYFIHNSDLGQLRMRVLEEVTGEHKGRSLDASYTFDLNYGGWRVNPYVSANYLTDDAVDYFFGVSQEESTAQLAAYEGKAGVNLTAGLNATYALTKNWDLGFGTSVTRLSDGIADSSLITDNMIYTASATVNYNF